MPQSATALTSSKTGPSGHGPHHSRTSTQHVFLLLLALRILNALTLRTFFQPDEYFQSLEPAWQIAFGQESGAWVTWEWKAQLRSSLHPAVFAAVYRAVATLASLCNPSLQSELLIAAPKVTQAVFAALLDCYTWKLAEKAYGQGARAAVFCLVLSVCSPWQWFCSTRTLSNCLETTITIIAVYHWPWHWPEAVDKRSKIDDDQYVAGCLFGLRASLLLAAIATILRPTNVLIWVGIAVPTLLQAPTRQRGVLVREAIYCGSAIFALSIFADRLYYKAWTVPPLRFLYFNIVQSLAVFYGKNRPDYYLTEGLPLLLTTALPFCLVGTWQALQGAPIDPKYGAQGVIRHRILKRLAWVVLFVTSALSVISHKEVRFLYPLLPFLHVISAGPVSTFLSPLTRSRKGLLVLILAVNVLVVAYTSQIHQRGVIDVLTYLRHKHETTRAGTTTVGFLMPCHSTPWRSHLVYPSIKAWALTCEPPLNVPLEKRDQYLDEADQFYLDPGIERWLTDHMEALQTISGSHSQMHWARQNPTFSPSKSRPWPQNLVFFEQLEAPLKAYLRTSNYHECWRGFNTHWHDDSRRKGDVIVWCLD